MDNPASLAVTIGASQLMPIYEFECEACGARFDELVPAGVAGVPCPECASESTKRRYSVPAATPRLALSPGNARKQEAKNAKLHADTKTRFKEGRRKAREAKAQRKGPQGG